MPDGIDERVEIGERIERRQFDAIFVPHRVGLDEIGVLFALRSDGEPQIRLFVVPPREFFPDYEPVIPSAVRTALDVTEAETVLLTVVSPPQGDEPATANLLAPIVVNARTGRAVQTVLDDSGWPLRAPLG